MPRLRCLSRSLTFEIALALSVLKFGTIHRPIRWRADAGLACASRRWRDSRRVRPRRSTASMATHSADASCTRPSSDRAPARPAWHALRGRPRIAPSFCSRQRCTAGRGHGISAGGDETNQVRRLAGYYEATRRDGAWYLGRQIPLDSGNCHPCAADSRCARPGTRESHRRHARRHRRHALGACRAAEQRRTASTRARRRQGGRLSARGRRAVDRGSTAETRSRSRSDT